MFGAHLEDLHIGEGSVFEDVAEFEAAHEVELEEEGVAVVDGHIFFGDAMFDAPRFSEAVEADIVVGFGGLEAFDEHFDGEEEAVVEVLVEFDGVMLVFEFGRNKSAKIEDDNAEPLEKFLLVGEAHSELDGGGGDEELDIAGYFFLAAHLEFFLEAEDGDAALEFELGVVGEVAVIGEVIVEDIDFDGGEPRRVFGKPPLVETSADDEGGHADGERDDDEPEVFGRGEVEQQYKR